MNNIGNDADQPIQFSVRTLLLLVSLVAILMGLTQAGSQLILANVAVIILLMGISIGLMFVSRWAGWSWIVSIVVGANLGAMLWLFRLLWDSQAVIRVTDSITYLVVGGLGNGWFAFRYVRGMQSTIPTLVRRNSILPCAVFLLALVAILGVGRMLQRSRLTQPFFAAMQLYQDNGSAVCEFWGHGINDDYLADRLSKIPSTGRLELSFHETRLTDRSVDELIEFRNLTRIDIRGTKITPVAAEKLRRALPGCTVYE